MTRLFEIISLFTRLGIIAFGGPAAHIAMMHKEVVEKRGWMNEEHYVDLIGATSLIPGPNSTEMAIHCGFQRGGIKGLVAAGLSFILPACLLTGLLAYFYVSFSHYPDFEKYLVGIKPVVLILIFDALRKLWKKAIKTKELLIVSALVLALSFTSLGEVLSLFAGALVGFLYFRFKPQGGLKAVEPFSVFLVFAKIGSVLFGSGYVLIAYLQHELINQRGWITAGQLADAIAIGQFTPGPVLSTSTFVGYLVGDVWGAVAATVGIFLPSFVFVLILNPLIPKMRQSKNFSILLDCVNAGAMGLMAYALVPLSQVSLTDKIGVITFIICGALYFKFSKQFTSVRLVALGAILGVGLHFLFKWMVPYV